MKRPISRRSGQQTITAVGTLGLLFALPIALQSPASAAAPAPQLWPSDPNWGKYVLGQSSASQKALSVASTSGTVTNADALVNGDGNITLTTVDATEPATVVLDWGTESSGKFALSVVSQTPVAAGASASLKISTSETSFGLYSTTNLSTVAGKGDTTLKVASVAGLQPGAKIWVGDVKRTVETVGTAGPNGTGITLTEALSKTYYTQTPVAVIVPSRINGDSGGFGLTSTQTVAVAAAGDVNPTNLFGGFRYQAIQLTTPGTVVISKNSLTPASFQSPKDAYEGYFVSNDDVLNRAWFSGAYTNALTMAPKSVTGKPVDVMFDGAKRDRGVWSGDVVVQGPVANHAFGDAGKSYWEGSIRDLLTAQRADGKVPGTTWQPFLRFYSDSYSNYSAISAIDYFKYMGDTTFAEEFKSKIESGVAYQATKLNARGLIEVNADPDYWQTPLSGEVSEYNAVYYELLVKAAWFERELGDTAKADQYTANAAALKEAMQIHLWSDTLGAYPQTTANDTDRATIPLDANSNALKLGLVPAGKEAGLLKTLEGHHTEYGSQMTRTVDSAVSEADPYGHEIEPLANYWEVQGRMAAGDTAGSLDVARTYWGQQVDENGPYYTGTTWEFIDKNGVVLRAADSMAHGWGAGITNVLSEDVLGIEPVDPGYATWEVAPEAADLKWAQGAVPIPGDKKITAKWGKTDQRFDLEVGAPAGTKGVVSVPLPTPSSQVTVNGTAVWKNGTFAPAAGVTSAERQGDRVEFTVSTAGTYLFQAGADDTPMPPVVTPPSKTTPSVSFKLSSSAVKAAQNAMATVVVKAQGVSSPTGTFTIRKGNKTLKTVTFRVGDRGKRTVTVPKLPRGKHTLKIVYSGGEGVSGKTSATRTLRVR